ncbi:DUF2500 domain-containing protein [Sutcliffiella horikoshii]|uniref:DUF2500 domain-containing protein n=1 Tax=Sutcliffiella horikoshii TaxID=79883 RepID=UPI0020411A37|nr:DUF2500 domain-containing protein [Sutcliffiella horikoshii]MCM3618435.1 DUF2500 domain-containing protein [Sutcliffiella horikoshii]
MSDPYSVVAGGDAMFQIVPIFIGIIFVIVIGSILISVFKGVGEWQKNEQSPRLSVPAVITSKRMDVSKRSNMHHHNDTHHHHSSSTHTKYFVTFEFESGDRSEFHVSGKEYGLLSEDDSGVLSFQGTRYLGFERNKVSKSGGEDYQGDYK